MGERHPGTLQRGDRDELGRIGAEAELPRRAGLAVDLVELLAPESCDGALESGSSALGIRSTHRAEWRYLDGRSTPRADTGHGEPEQ
jgi:hypothetical protein